MAHFTMNGYNNNGKFQGPINPKGQSTKLKSQKYRKHIKSLELALKSTNNQLTCHKKYLKAL